MPRLVDCMHLGRDRVIGAWEVRPGVIVDPGPASCLPALLGGLEAQPRALLLTHIHLDHAGAAGTLARRFGELRVYVHEAGAPHLADPSRLVRSAGRLYGERMDELWGEIAPVPAERLVALRGGEEVEGLRVEHAPGHAANHVVYVDEHGGDAYVGDVAGVRIPPAQLAMAPTPPPEIDVDAWLRSLAMLAELRPRRLRMTHFGTGEEPQAQLEAVAGWLRDARARSRDGDAGAFGRWVEAALAELEPDVAERMRQAMPPAQLWLGLERYWRKRREPGG